MKKYIKKHLKDEKRILKLMYQKGVINDLGVNLKYCGWEYSKGAKRLRKRKGKREYSHKEYLPELHVFETDYWGESDSYSIVSRYKEVLYWNGMKSDDDYNSYKGQSFNNSKLIKYLSTISTKQHKGSFNKLLKITQE